MARMLGDNVLPESLQSRRRSIRNRLKNLREPIRRRRSEAVPGPDVIGSLESRVSGLRDKVVDRDSALENIRSQVGGDNGAVSSGPSNTDESGGTDTSSPLSDAT